jgi:hypothetical protein
VAYELTHIPASVFDDVGISSPKAAVTPPTVIHSQPALVLGGKPGVFYMGGEFCPYCAAERWALTAAMSRFGTVSGLYTMQSSSTDVYPSTQTVTFAHAKFSSPYVDFVPREYYANYKTSAGTSWAVLQPLSKSQSALVKKYDTSTFTGGSATSSGSIPFIDLGNKALVSGSSYSPVILQGLSRTTIASGLSDPKNTITEAIVAAANYLSAAVCTTDGEKPAAVCTSKGVSAAAKAMGLSS